MADAPVVLILAPDAIAALPAITAGLTTLDTTPTARGERRRRVLAALADGALIRGERDRRLAGTSLFASVAERDGWAAAALAPWAVGVDVETVAGADEAADAVLAGVVAVDRAAWPRLAGLWTAREAVLKAVGRDLSADPGGWRFADGVVTATGIAAHRVDTLDLGPVVAAVAYAGA